jgi:hypothetical protein
VFRATRNNAYGRGSTQLASTPPPRAISDGLSLIHSPSSSAHTLVVLTICASTTTSGVLLLFFYCFAMCGNWSICPWFVRTFAFFVVVLVQSCARSSRRNDDGAPSRRVWSDEGGQESESQEKGKRHQRKSRRAGTHSII